MKWFDRLWGSKEDIDLIREAEKPEILNPLQFQELYKKTLRLKKKDDHAWAGLENKLVMYPDGRIYQVLTTGWRRREDMERLVKLKMEEKDGGPSTQK